MPSGDDSLCILNYCACTHAHIGYRRLYIYIHTCRNVTSYSLLCVTRAQHPAYAPTPPPMHPPPRHSASLGNGRIPTAILPKPDCDSTEIRSRSDRKSVGLRSTSDQFVATNGRDVGGHNSIEFWPKPDRFIGANAVTTNRFDSNWNPTMIHLYRRPLRVQGLIIVWMTCPRSDLDRDPVATTI